MARIEITLKYIGTGATKQLVNFVCEEGRNFIEDYIRIKVRNNVETTVQLKTVLVDIQLQIIFTLHSDLFDIVI